MFVLTFFFLFYFQNYERLSHYIILENKDYFSVPTWVSLLFQLFKVFIFVSYGSILT